MMAREILSGISMKPYWLDHVGDLPDTPAEPLRSADVLIVGSGYTGLNAAIETARGARSTLVLDAQNPGFGCSTRNGGQISTSVKPSFDKLSAKFGPDRARAIRLEGENALTWIEERIKSEGIDCDFARVGRYHAAHTPDHYETLARDAQKLARQEGVQVHTVPRQDQRSELGSDCYYGGVVFSRHASLHPAKYHRGLLRAAIDAGVHVTGNCAVTGINRSATGFTVTTEKGKIAARDVIVATNGYTTSATPWFQRRVIPIGSNIIATKPLPTEVMDRLFPTNRIASDTCKVVYYYRPSPDRKRVIFGGRVAAHEIGADAGAPILYDSMCRIFPELRDYGLSHSWSGTVAYTFDELAHTGVHDGVHYAMGYCGSGVSMASYLGMRAGQKVLGLAVGQTAFDGLTNPTRPMYYGKPWFLPAAVAWYRWKDRRQYEKAAQMV